MRPRMQGKTEAVLPKRTARIPIRFTRDEYDLIVRSADREGEARLSAWIRLVVFRAKAWRAQKRTGSGTRQVSVHLRPTELRKAKALAAEHGVTVTEFVRGAVLGEAS
jgi:hypothetical protein